MFNQRPARPLVSRQWTGVVKAERAGDYIAHLHTDTLPALRALQGFVSATILQRETEDGREFRVVTVWRSLASIEAFAGTDITAAVVPPAAQAMMVRYERHATHYEIVSVFP